MRDSNRTDSILPLPTRKSIQQTHKTRVFQLGDPVLRKVFENTVDPMVGKFQANWEGLYIVTRASKSGSYALDKLDRKPVPRIWNAMHLKRYYQ